MFRSTLETWSYYSGGMFSKGPISTASTLRYYKSDCKIGRLRVTLFKLVKHSNIQVREDKFKDAVDKVLLEVGKMLHQQIASMKQNNDGNYHYHIVVVTEAITVVQQMTGNGSDKTFSVTQDLAFITQIWSIFTSEWHTWKDKGQEKTVMSTTSWKRVT